MKTPIRLLILFCLCICSVDIYAMPINPPPPNDQQCNATDLGLLDFVPCGAGDSVTVSGDTEWAAYDYAWPVGSSCFPLGSPDVWYKFTTRSTYVRINLFSTTVGFDSIFVRIFDEQNNCVNLIPLNCSTTQIGSMLVDFYTPTFNGVYYLEIGGYDEEEEGTFELTVAGVESCNECVMDMSIELNTPPVNGQYYPGDVVEMCLTIDRFNTQGISSLHSIIPTLVGAEWLPNSIVPINTPSSPNTTNGWIWTTASTPLGPQLGFFYDGDLDSNPNNNTGDAATILQSWQACWEAIVKPAYSGGDLLTKIYVFNDGQTGSAATTSCGPDPALKLELKAFSDSCVSPIVFVNGSIDCNNGTAIIGVSNANASDTIDYYLYDVNNQAVDSALNITITSFVFPVSNAGSYTLSAYNQSTGCYTITAVKVPFVLLSNVNQVSISCGPGNGVAQASVTGGTAPYTFYWPQTNATGSTAFNLSDGWNYVVITDTLNCSVTDSVFIVSSPIPQAAFDYPDEFICGDQVVVQDIFPQTPGGLYTLISPQSVAGISVDQFTGEIDLNAVSSASLPVWVVVEYRVGVPFCTDFFRDSIYVTGIPAAPQPDNQSTTLSWCNPSAIPVLQITAVQGQNPVWFDAFGNLVALGTSYTPPFTSNTPAGAYTYYVIFTPNIVGATCYSLPTIYTVNVSNGFTITATADTTICPDEPIQLNINGCATCSYNWLPSSGLDNPFSSSPIATVAQTTAYFVTATDQNSGCEAYELITIATDTALCEDSTTVVLEIFNGITPNADGKNDVWIISGIENASNVRVTIFNRWGGIIWNTNRYNNTDIVFRGFDENGNAVADGTYYYLITIGTKTRRGWLEVTR